MFALLGKVAIRTYDLTVQFMTESEEDAILGALGIVDLTLTASLVVLVIFSGYANFISRIDVDAHPGWPRWMAEIDFGELKLKLTGSIVAISMIKLLEVYMNIDHETDRQLGVAGGHARRIRRGGAAAGRCGLVHPSRRASARLAL